MNISGAQRLPSGNLLVCNGPAGRVFEVTAQGAKVWDYINPVGMSGPVAQGSTPTQNILFRAPFYARGYAAFAGRTLTAGAPLEFNPSASTCSLALAGKQPAAEAVAVWPNPAHATARVRVTGWPAGSTGMLTVLDAVGRAVRSQPAVWPEAELSLTGLPAGVYALRISAGAESAIRRLLVE